MLNAHHIESFKMCKSLRYDLHNGISLCPKNHKLSKDAFHTGFVVAYDTIPKDIVDYLREHRNDEIVIDKEYLENKIKELEMI